MTTRIPKLIFALPVALVLFAACASAPETRQEQQALFNAADATLDAMVARDPSLREVLNNAYGYVVFPEVGEGGFIVGGRSGVGVVYERGQPVGYARLREGTVGFQAGGASFAELIVLHNPSALQRLRDGNFQVTAGAQAVVLDRGVARSTDFSRGSAVFIMPRGGLIGGVAVGGQQVSFEPLV
jgi:lipid-binding SYLF domain-containing protein